MADKVEERIGGLGTSCLELFVQACFRAATFAEEMARRYEFSREVLALAERPGVELAFPARTIRVAGAADEPTPSSRP